MINQRGISGVVTTVLLILITIAAATLVAQIVIPFVKNSLQAGGECVPYRNYFKFEDSFTYQGKTYFYDCEKNGNYGAIVKSQNGVDNSNIRGFAILLTDDALSKKVTILAGDSAGEAKMINSSNNLTIPAPGETNTYVLSVNTPNLTSMSIYPVLMNGRLCDKSDQIAIIKCAEDIVLS